MGERQSRASTVKQLTLWPKLDRELYHSDKMLDWLQERDNVYSEARWKAPKLWR